MRLSKVKSTPVKLWLMARVRVRVGVRIRVRVRIRDVVTLLLFVMGHVFMTADV